MYITLSVIPVDPEQYLLLVNILDTQRWGLTANGRLLVPTEEVPLALHLLTPYELVIYFY